MFSQACVKNSVHWGVCLPSTPLHAGIHPPGRLPWADTPEQMSPQADTPLPEMATAADGTHPTGMHSCFAIV